jgi:hypothetical protein
LSPYTVIARPAVPPPHGRKARNANLSVSLPHPIYDTLLRDGSDVSVSLSAPRYFMHHGRATAWNPKVSSAS